MERVVTVWPDLSYALWRDTAATLQLWTQIVGKVRRNTHGCSEARDGLQPAKRVRRRRRGMRRVARSSWEGVLRECSSGAKELSQAEGGSEAANEAQVHPSSADLSTREMVKIWRDSACLDARAKA